jgi:ABC-type oligopeptide transport system ATPase subunit
MSIKGFVEELEKIETEIKINNKKNATLRKRVKEIKENIAQFLREKDQVGLKHNGRAIIMETTEKRIPKKKKEKEASVLSLLEELGIDEPDKAYQQLLEVQKGEAVEKHNIKIKKLQSEK